MLFRSERHRLLVEENVRLQLEHLRDYPFVARAIASGTLKIHGWVYDIANGEIKPVSSSA